MYWLRSDEHGFIASLVLNLCLHSTPLRKNSDVTGIMK